jgi:hypothetical protein
VDGLTAAVLFGFVICLFLLQRRLFVELKIKGMPELLRVLSKKDGRTLNILCAIFFGVIQIILLKAILGRAVLKKHNTLATGLAIVLVSALVFFALQIAFRTSKPAAPARWFYFVPYQEDIYKALKTLRDVEFAAGRYYPVIAFPQFPVTPESPKPGAKHLSINEAIAASVGIGGSHSILDVHDISERLTYGAVAPLSGRELLALYGTQEPSREMIEQNMDFFEDIDGGQGVYIITFKDGNPCEICFAGHSYS